MDGQGVFFCYIRFAGLIGMDWMALLVNSYNIILTIIIVESAMRRIKRIPISVGVLNESDYRDTSSREKFIEKKEEAIYS